MLLLSMNVSCFLDGATFVGFDLRGRDDWLVICLSGGIHIKPGESASVNHGESIASAEDGTTIFSVSCMGGVFASRRAAGVDESGHVIGTTQDQCDRVVP